MDKDLISRSALVEYCQRLAIDEWNNKTAPTSWACAYGEFADMVEAAPAVDAVEVVRCKDCRWYQIRKWDDGKPEYDCRKTQGLLDVRPEDFCSYGERRRTDAGKV